MAAQPIGIFDSGYGCLTVMKEIVKALPQYDYVYLGDNARAPYGSRSFESVHRYTWECVQWFFSMNCPLVILACNTASAKALRSIQQQDLPRTYPDKRVLGVIRPTTEKIGAMSNSNRVGILATKGTVLSDSYAIEIHKFFPGTEVYQEACPMWVPLIENNEHQTAGADFFIQKHLNNLFQQEKGIDTVLLACTHYPLIEAQIRKYLPNGVILVSQGQIVATSLADYLVRHPEIEGQISRSGERNFYTTDSTEDFDNHAAVFFGEEVKSKHVTMI